jgi:Short C-terminal domain
MKRIAIYLSLSMFLVACGGRTAHPVADYKPGDEDMSCSDLKAEMSHIETEVDKLIPESKKTGKNVALGAAGLFLIFPWFFMDVGDAEKTEIRAYNERYLALEKLYAKNCAAGKDNTENSVLVTDTPMEDRLNRLVELKEQGLITDEEYTSRRREILGEI